jgi:hypothetical protein
MKFVTRSFRVILVCLLLGVFLIQSAPADALALSGAKVADITDLAGITRDSAGKQVVKGKFATREEFAQMLVQASLSAGDVKATKTSKLFQDVKTNSKKAAYIQMAVSKGYMSGYLGGKFKPTQAVTLKEAAYGTLAILGYTNEDFNNRISGSRFDKFKELGLNENINKGETDKLTKANCTELFYNLLNAKNKSGQIYAQTLGYGVDTDGKINYQSLLEKKSKGPVLVEGNWSKKLAKDISNYKILQDDKSISSDDISEYSIIYYAEQLSKVWVYDKKIFGNLDSITYNNGAPQQLTVSGTVYNVENPDDISYLIRNYSIKQDKMVVLLLGRDDKVSHIMPLNSRLAGGNWRSSLGFNPDNAMIYKNGKRISVSDVKNTDVIYYTKELNSIWVYRDTVYGVLNSVSPTLSAPTAITVAGKTYDLTANPVNSSGTDTGDMKDMNENAWGTRLLQNGVQEGDNVAVAFGYNGKVAEIYKIDQMSATLSGYVLDIVEKVVKDNNRESSVSKVLRIVETGGTELEIPTTDTSFRAGDLVEVSFQNGTSSVVKVDYFNANNISDVPSKKLASDAKVLEVNEKNYTKVATSRIKEITWGSEQIVFCRVNSAGEITDLILRYITDSYFQCGLLKTVVAADYSKGIYSTQLTFDFGTEQTISVDSVPGDINPGPKAVKFENNQIKEMKNLQMARLLYIDGKQAHTENKAYRISDDVLVFFYKAGNYYKGTLDDVISKKGTLIDGYMENANGPIRIIVVTK